MFQEQLISYIDTQRGLDKKVTVQMLVTQLRVLDESLVMVKWSILFRPTISRSGQVSVVGAMVMTNDTLLVC
jgi:hypothetical protein